jgi:hypothetical protein
MRRAWAGASSIPSFFATKPGPGTTNLETVVTDLATNVLDHGDNLDILRRYLPDAAVDLVYLDPPHAADAQLLAFGQAAAGFSRRRPSP